MKKKKKKHTIQITLTHSTIRHLTMKITHKCTQKTKTCQQLKSEPKDSEK